MASGKRFLLLDGGLATELSTTHGHNHIDGDPLWSARLIITHPSDIALAHQSYLEVGCDVIETATYQASIAGFQQHLSVDFSEATDIIKQAVDIALKARDEFWTKNKHKGSVKPLVAGSIGPYGAHLADGSEFNGHYVDTVSFEDLSTWHRSQVDVIWNSGVDILAFETIPSQIEALAILRILREFPHAKAWITFSCQDGKHTCRGEEFSSAVACVLASDQVTGCGVNCTAPWFVESLLGSIPPAVRRTKTIIAYPNSGQTWTPNKGLSGVNDGCQQLHCYVDRWMELGASWIGGCCTVTTKDLELIRKVIDEHCRKDSSAD